MIKFKAGDSVYYQGNLCVIMSVGTGEHTDPCVYVRKNNGVVEIVPANHLTLSWNDIYTWNKTSSGKWVVAGPGIELTICSNEDQAKALVDLLDDAFNAGKKQKTKDINELLAG